MSVLDLPRGMRLNNPGNLRSGYGLKYRAPIVDGFAQFATLEDGVTSLCKLTWDYYVIHRRQTMTRFISVYAPASENDYLAYIKAMEAITGFDAHSPCAEDLRLDESHRALVFMQALVLIEQGHPPRSWQNFPVWIPGKTWLACMSRTGKWSDL